MRCLEFGVGWPTWRVPSGLLAFPAMPRTSDVCYARAQALCQGRRSRQSRTSHHCAASLPGHIVCNVEALRRVLLQRRRKNICLKMDFIRAATHWSSLPIIGGEEKKEKGKKKRVDGWQSSLCEGGDCCHWSGLRVCFLQKVKLICRRM